MSDEEKKNSLGRPERLFENLFFVKYSISFKNLSKASQVILCFIWSISEHFLMLEKAITRNQQKLEEISIFNDFWFSFYSCELSLLFFLKE